MGEGGGGVTMSQGNLCGDDFNFIKFTHLQIRKGNKERQIAH